MTHKIGRDIYLAALWFGGTQSLCCRFKEDRNLMALAGKGTAHSAGYREAPPEED